MKHLKHSFTIILLLLTLVTCSNNDDENGSILPPTLEIDQNERIQNASTGATTFSITVKSNNKFTATSSASDWCKTTIENKETGNLTISVTENTNANVRSAEVTVKTEGLSPIIIKINQLGTSPAFLVKEKSVELVDDTYAFILDITTNTETGLEFPEWIYLQSKPSATKYQFSAYTLPDSEINRKGEIVISAKSSSINIQPIAIPVVQKRTIYPRFAVISDTHFGLPESKEKVAKALKNIMKENPLLDAIFVVGDMTESARIGEYDDLIQVFGANVPKSTPVYFMLGNHDHTWYDGSPISKYMNKIKQPVHQYIKIKGFPFITISVKGPYDNTYYTQTEIDFLSTNLEDASKKYPGQPIFVFAHVGVYNTVYGTSQGWGDNTLASILSKYPQAVIFSGHSHFPMADPRSIHQNTFTSVNVGNTSYSEIEGGFSDGVHPEGNDKVTEGVIVSIKENFDVELGRRDTYRNEEIQPKWIVKAPHNGTAFTYANRTGGSSPYFKGSDKPSVSNITANACTVSFPQATDDEVVHHYNVEIVNNDGHVYKTMAFFSQFYLNSSMPNPLSCNITGLESNTTYTVQVTAVDSYNNKSSKIETAKFATIN